MKMPLSLDGDDDVDKRRKTDLWWVAAVERIGVGTMVALVVLYLGWRTLGELAEVVRANTTAINGLNATMAKQGEKIDALGDRLFTIERETFNRHSHDTDSGDKK